MRLDDLISLVIVARSIINHMLAEAGQACHPAASGEDAAERRGLTNGKASFQTGLLAESEPPRPFMLRDNAETHPHSGYEDCSHDAHVSANTSTCTIKATYRRSCLFL